MTAKKSFLIPWKQPLKSLFRWLRIAGSIASHPKSCHERISIKTISYALRNSRRHRNILNWGAETYSRWWVQEYLDYPKRADRACQLSNAEDSKETRKQLRSISKKQPKIDRFSTLKAPKDQDYCFYENPLISRLLRASYTNKAYRCFLKLGCNLISGYCR